MGNAAPVIDSFAANPNPVEAGAPVLLTCVAHDTDGTIVRYDWSATDGTFPSGGLVESTVPPSNTINWTAPATPGSYTLTVRVYDSGGLFGGSATATASLVVEVVQGNTAPTITNLTASGALVAPGAQVDLSCTASDPEGDPLTYTWWASAGTVVDHGNGTAVWTAPEQAGWHTIRVNVSDPTGASAAASVNVEVRFVEYAESLGAPTRIPIRIAVAPWGDVYVSEPDRVLMMRSNGELLQEIRGVDRPLAVMVTARKEVLVGEQGTGGIRAFDVLGNYLRTVVPEGTITNPNDMCQGSDGTLYVTDSEANRVWRFTESGESLGTFGALGTGPGQFDFPTGIAFDDETGELLVADQHNHRVQVFDADGNYVREIANGGSLGQFFGYLQGLSVDPKGRLVTVDSFQGRVGVFSRAGEFLGTVGTFGAEPGKLLLPNDAAVDATGRVLVTSTNTGRVEVYQLQDVSGEYEPRPKLDQTIRFDPLAHRFVDDPPFELSATASSGLPVSFGIAKGPATLADATVTLTGQTGEVVVFAFQEGDEFYNPAPVVKRVFSVLSVPIISSGPTATPNPQFAGSPVTFNAGGYDELDAALEYHWAFGDGTFGVGSQVSHTYVAPGNYTVKMLVMNAWGKTATGAVRVTVLEEQGALLISGAQAFLNLGAGARNKDGLLLTGMLALPWGTGLSGQPVEFFFGGVVSTGTLNGRGDKAVGRDLLIQFTPSGTTPDGRPQYLFDAYLKRGSWAALLADEGCTNVTTTGSPVTVEVRMTIGKTVCPGQVSGTWSAQAGVSGLFEGQ